MTRELMLSKGKMSRFAFLALPEELQDEVMFGLDDRTLTLRAAAELVKERMPRGEGLSHHAIASYYHAVRRHRRIRAADHALCRLHTELAGQSLEESRQGLINLKVVICLAGLLDGSLKLKDIPLGQLTKTFRGTHAPPRNKKRYEAEKP